MSGSNSNPLIVDVHTHIYPPSYITLLSSRTTVPYIHRPTDPSLDARLIILASDDDHSRPVHLRGRPIDKSYSSWSEKLSFMALHNISISVVSLANPWLDFLDPDTALQTAQHINNDLNDACQTHNSSSSSSDGKSKLYAFGCLPLTAPPSQIISEIHRLKTLPFIRGIIMGTTGLGSGLDDPRLLPILTALSETSTLIFLHPHYGLPSSVLGSTAQNYGHVLPLALGFPLETTIAITRLYLSRAFDKLPNLQILLAHSGGTLPFLAGRIQSCVQHERDFVANGGHVAGPERDIFDVLRRNIWLDAVIYDSAGLGAAVEVGGDAAGEGKGGRVMFGTDHPFFPPLKSSAAGGKGEEEEGKWASVRSNLAAIEKLGEKLGEKMSKEDVEGMLGGNAVRLLGLEI